MITRLVCTGAAEGIDAYENIARRSFLTERPPMCHSRAGRGRHDV